MNQEFPKFKIIHGERRKSDRDSYYEPTNEDCTLTVNGTRLNAQLTSIDFGIVQIIAKNSNEIVLANKSICNLEITDSSKKIIVSGEWSLENKTPTKDFGYLLTFKVKDYDELCPYFKLYNPEFFLKLSNYKLLQLENNLEDAEKWGQHITEVKDFPGELEALIEVNGKQVPAFFDFQSESREISNLEFRLLSTVDTTSWIGKTAFIHYCFLGIRITMQSKIIEYDEIFNILVISNQKSAFLATSRKYDRYKIEKKIPIHIDSTPGFLKEISMNGCRVELSQNPYNLGKKVTLKTNDLSIICTIKSKNRTGYGLEFSPESELEYNNLRSLYFNSLPQPYKSRNPKNYDSFVDLYTEVGYFSTSEQDLTKQSLETWLSVDKILPSNTLGAVEADDSLSISVGSFPFSSNTIYGHSAALKHNLSAIIKLFNVMGFSLGWGNFLPKIQYWGGSAKKSSRIMSRFLTAYEYHGAPSSIEILDAIVIDKGGRVKTPATPAHLEIKKIQEGDDTPNENLHPFIKYSIKAHDYTKNLHTISHFEILKNGGERVAYFILHKSIPRVTATDLLNCAYIILTGCSEIDQIAYKIREELGDDIEIDIFSRTSIQKQLLENAHEVIWYFSRLDDQGPMFSSMCRAIYKVTRKYGAEGVNQFVS